MVAQFDGFLQALALRMCREAQRTVERDLESRTLRRALNCRIDPAPPGTAIVRLNVPHYWAIYYHDGRGPVRPRRGRFLVYFRSIEDDPRVNGTASPERFSQTKRLRLRPETFRRLVAQGKLLVRTSVGPAAGNPFFAGLTDFSNRVAKITEPALSTFVRGNLRAARVDRLRLSGEFVL